jgi:hypothetical protein
MVSWHRRVDGWVERLDDKNSDLWKELVPAEGNANSVQGELVRAIGRLQTENFRNEMTNWGDGSLECSSGLVTGRHAVIDV